jgi:hypothetical protein
MISALSLPQRGRGKPSPEAETEFQEKVIEFCGAVKELKASLDFEVSARGWCYILEEHGLSKGDFDKAQRLILTCRKNGNLPLDIVADDGSRSFDNLEDLDEDDDEGEAEAIVDRALRGHKFYNPISLWDNQPVFVQMLVEKIDLKSLFSPVCGEYHVPIANARGWSDLNSRAAMMRLFRGHEDEGRQCVLLYCGDHDPSGLSISEFLRSNMEEIADAEGVEWHPDELIIDRFGLNTDFIEANNLTWIDGLQTGSGMDLADEAHAHANRAYVKGYIERFGARKVEANALVVRPGAGRRLCREAILQYVDESLIEAYRAELQARQELVRLAVLERLAQRGH